MSGSELQITIKRIEDFLPEKKKEHAQFFKNVLKEGEFSCLKTKTNLAES